MDKLDKARKVINEVDKQMAELFEKRMNAVKDVAEYKKVRGLPILDKVRENQVIEKNVSYIKDDNIRRYYVQFQKDAMAVSRRYQHDLIKGNKVAYCGVEGAFAQIAAKKIFPDSKLVSYKSFEEAYQSVVDGICEKAVLPVENSTGGVVGQVHDLLFNGNLYVNGIYNLQIVHNLLAKPGTNMKDIKTVISHPQALAQCRQYILEHGFKQVEESNTAVSAKKVAESDDRSVAAIASKNTADLYGLSVLDHDINLSSSNTTKFVVLSSIPNKDISSSENGFILMFTVNDTAGSLAKAIDVIGKYGFNMSVLCSRPDRGSEFNYYFYSEVVGNATSKLAKTMLKELQLFCKKLKVVGNYNAAITMEVVELEG